MPGERFFCPGEYETTILRQCRGKGANGGGDGAAAGGWGFWRRLLWRNAERGWWAKEVIDSSVAAVRRTRAAASLSMARTYGPKSLEHRFEWRGQAQGRRRRLAG